MSKLWSMGVAVAAAAVFCLLMGGLTVFRSAHPSQARRSVTSRGAAGIDARQRHGSERPTTAPI